MRLIEPNATIFAKPEATDKAGVLRYLEEIGRVCYKSEDNITEDSAKKFITKLKQAGHWAMLEHYVFSVNVSDNVYKTIRKLAEDKSYTHASIEQKMSFLKFSSYMDIDCNAYNVVTGSATAFNYFFRALANWIPLSSILMVNNINLVLLQKMADWLHEEYPELFIKAFIVDDQHMQGAEQMQDIDTDGEFRFLTQDEIKEIPDPAYITHEWFSAKFITNRGVSHEIVRHRPASYAQESTRYCNYQKDKFGNEISVIKPHFYENEKLYNIWENSMLAAEIKYFEMIDADASPQQAREILPNSLKTEIIMTANIMEWIHFFNMRCAINAHPEMQIVANKVLEEFVIWQGLDATSNGYDNQGHPEIRWEYKKLLEPEVIMRMQRIIERRRLSVED